MKGPGAAPSTRLINGLQRPRTSDVSGQPPRFSSRNGRLPQGGIAAYQQNAGNRCAKRHSRRSHTTVGAEVMCSHRVQLCALLARPEFSSAVRGCYRLVKHASPSLLPSAYTDAVQPVPRHLDQPSLPACPLLAGAGHYGAISPTSIRPRGPVWRPVVADRGFGSCPSRRLVLPTRVASAAWIRQLLTVDQQLLSEHRCLREVVALERQPEQRPDRLPF